MARDDLGDFACDQFTFAGYTYPVYRKGMGPAIIVIHEVPGITPEVARFARTLVDAGFTVLMPSLFGSPGKVFSAAYASQQLALSCVRREFAVMASDRTSPVVAFLRGLAQAAHQELGMPVGAIGMCLTGNFALAMSVDPWLQAPVLSQPSLPFGATPALRRGLHISPADLERVRERARTDGLRVLGARFTGDPLCTGARFRALADALGDAFDAIEIDSRPGNPAGISPLSHSVVTKDLVDQAGHPTRVALERIIGFFREQLLP